MGETLKSSFLNHFCFHYKSMLCRNYSTYATDWNSSFPLFLFPLIIQYLLFFQLRCPSSWSHNCLYSSLCSLCFLKAFSSGALTILNNFVSGVSYPRLWKNVVAWLVVLFTLLSPVLNTLPFTKERLHKCLSNCFKLKKYIIRVDLNKFTSSYTLDCQ